MEEKQMLSSLLDAKKTFFDLHPSFEEADVVILPVPYDETATYLKGTSNAPDAILESSMQLEEYDIELGFKTCDKLSIMTLAPLPVEEKKPEEMVEEVAAVVQEIVKAGKKPIVLGGEHSITAGVVKGLKDPSVSVLQIDAHADLRDSYEGSKHNHACAMARVRELSDRVVQIGIRSMCDEEAEYIREKGIEKNIFYAHEFSKEKINEIISQLGEKVYVTVDVDGFDPSIMPGTGTPEPGGVGWYDVLDIMKVVGKEKQVMGFDIVEVVPIPPLHISEFTAAKLLYKMIGYFWAHQ